MTRLVLALVVGSAACAPDPPADEPPRPGPPGAVRPPGDVLPEHRQYAVDYGVSVDEAVRRLGLQGALGAFGALAETSEPETFAGYWIEHEPTFGAVAAFTGDAQATLDRLLDGRTPPAPIRAVTRPYALRELLAVQAQTGRDLIDAGVRVEGVGTDVVRGRILVLVRDTARAQVVVARRGLRLHPAVAWEQGAVETLVGDAETTVPRPTPPPPPPRPRTP